MHPDDTRRRQVGGREVESAHGGNIWEAGRKYGFQPRDLLDFSASINPLGPPRGAVKKILDCVGVIRYYPEPEADGLRDSLAQYLGIPPKNLLLGNGSVELLYAVSRELYRERILLAVPTFSEYGRGINNPCVKRVYLDPGEGFCFSVQKMLAELQPRDLVFICNPNNPTGRLVERGEILLLVEKALTLDARVVVDEAFMDFTDREQTVVPFVKDYSNLLVLGSLTKFFALPGLRIGYLAAGSSLLRRLFEILPPWRLNIFASIAGKEALGDREYIKATRELIETERKFLFQGLAGVRGLQPFPSSANFLLVNISNSGLSGFELQEELGARGILIRRCSNFAGLNDFFIRVAVRTRGENLKLLTALKEILENQVRDNGGRKE